MSGYPSFIKEQEVQQTGGNVIVEVVELHAGPTITISDDCIAIHKTRAHWEDRFEEDLDGENTLTIDIATLEQYRSRPDGTGVDIDAYLAQLDADMLVAVLGRALDVLLETELSKTGLEPAGAEILQELRPIITRYYESTTPIG